MLYDKNDQLIEALGRLQELDEEPCGGNAASEIHEIYKDFKEEVRANIQSKENLPESLIYLSRLSHTYQELGRRMESQLHSNAQNGHRPGEKKTGATDFHLQKLLCPDPCFSGQ
jgi:hypothetical protein